MIRVAYNKAEQIIQNDVKHKFNPSEMIKTSGAGQVSALRAIGLDMRCNSIEYHDQEGKISKIELIKARDIEENVIQAKAERKAAIQIIKQGIKSENGGIFPKIKETIIHFR